MSKNNRTLSARHGQSGLLYEALAATIEAADGSVTQSLADLAKERQISPATLLGTHSFYDFLQPDNHGKRTYVCTGTACLLANKQQQVKKKHLKQFSEDEIGEVACLGHCYHGGAYWQDMQVFDAESAQNNASAPPLIPYTNAARHSLFTDDIGDVDSFYQNSFQEPKSILTELSNSQLRGRGGAGFYFIDKLTACANTPAGQKYIVCNGDEGDPGAFSDRYLLEEQAQRVLVGMLAAAHVVGADTAYLYIRAEYPLAQQRMREAIQAFEKTPAFTKNRVQFHVIRGAGSYVCGEETALLNSIEGLRPEVRTRPPYPTQEGLFGQPTLLSNVETFAAVPWILQHGGKAFAAIGTKQSAGTKLLSLDYNFNRPGVHEVELGIPLQQVIDECGGGFHHAVKALQIGGPLGCIVPMDKVSELMVDYESFSQQGFQLGHAGIIAIPKEFPMIDFLRHLFAFMAHESCGKCVPCRLGTQKGHTLLVSAINGEPIVNETFADLLDALEMGSLCGLGGGLPLPVRNILQYFSDELEEYFVGETS